MRDKIKKVIDQYYILEEQDSEKLLDEIEQLVIAEGKQLQQQIHDLKILVDTVTDTKNKEIARLEGAFAGAKGERSELLEACKKAYESLANRGEINLTLSRAIAKAED